MPPPLSTHQSPTAAANKTIISLGPRKGMVASCQASALLSEGLPCAQEENVREEDTLLPSVSIEWVGEND